MISKMDGSRYSFLNFIRPQLGKVSSFDSEHFYFAIVAAYGKAVKIYIISEVLNTVIRIEGLVVDSLKKIALSPVSDTFEIDF